MSTRKCWALNLLAQCQVMGVDNQNTYLMQTNQPHPAAAELEGVVLDLLDLCLLIPRGT